MRRNRDKSEQFSRNLPDTDPQNNDYLENSIDYLQKCHILTVWIEDEYGSTGVIRHIAGNSVLEALQAHLIRGATESKGIQGTGLC